MNAKHERNRLVDCRQNLFLVDGRGSKFHGKHSRCTSHSSYFAVSVLFCDCLANAFCLGMFQRVHSSPNYLHSCTSDRTNFTCQIEVRHEQHAQFVGLEWGLRSQTACLIKLTGWNFGFGKNLHTCQNSLQTWSLNLPRVCTRVNTKFASIRVCHKFTNRFACVQI